MATAWSEIISDYAMLYINDTRLQDEAVQDPAAFLRKMSLYVLASVPELSSPPELFEYIKSGMVDATYDDATWTSTTTSMTQQTTVQTGITGYSLFSCAIQTTDSAGNITVTPYTEATYDSATGNVTFPIQSASGIYYVMDFYNDGSFTNELTQTMKTLLGKAIAVVWDERFDNDWLANTMKIHDQSFTNVNESNYMNAKGTRHSRKRAELASDLRKYEQDCAARAVIPTAFKIKNFV